MVLLDISSKSQSLVFEIISSSPSEAIFSAMLLGFLWGIGGIMFGVSVPYIGLSLTMGIVMGLAGSAGSLIPFFQIDDVFSQPAFPYVIGGIKQDVDKDALKGFSL